MFIREVDYVWPLAVKVSFIADLLSYHDTIGESKGTISTSVYRHFLMEVVYVPKNLADPKLTLLDIPAEAQNIITMYQKLVQQTLDYGIESCYTFKPILDVSGIHTTTKQ